MLGGQRSWRPLCRNCQLSSYLDTACASAVMRKLSGAGQTRSAQIRVSTLSGEPLAGTTVVRPRGARKGAYSVRRLAEGRLGGRVDWQTITGLGACGGALVTVVAFSADVTSWQRARRVARDKGERELPSLAAFVDLPADSLSLATRMALGAIAGLLFSAQVSG